MDLDIGMHLIEVLRSADFSPADDLLARFEGTRLGTAMMLHP